MALWRPDEEFAVYPEGARDKSLLYSPDPAAHDFLVPNHRYLFKHSNSRYPDQFWTEIIAYRIGCMLGVAVPPAFVAWDSSSGVCGALIEWFLDYPDGPDERYVPGGDYMTRMIPGYERKKGRQHNFEHITALMIALTRTGKFADEWHRWWCDTLLFDALIGNTDRHQDNWGLLLTADGKARMAPVFDNGTSLGHEIFPHKMAAFYEPGRLAHYINRGTHHLRWHIADQRPGGHAALIARLYVRSPDLREHVKKRLASFNMEAMGAIISGMTEFDIPIPLSPVRAEFVRRLTEARYQTLVDALT